MNLLQKKRNMQQLWLLCLLITLAGCCNQQPVKEYISVKPKAAPLSETTLQAMQPNSTEVLNRAGLWYENSGKLLDSVMLPSGS